MDEFLRNLEKSNLLNAEQWAAARREIAAAQVVRRDGHGAGASAVGRADGPRELAVWLVEKRFVTRWQADMLLAGKKAFFLGKYRLLDCIGTGGMGAVFKALHVDMGRTVAVKILSAEVMKNRHAVARFRQEIQAVAALDDPHIVAAYDAGNERGTNYLVMEYVEGHDLGHLVKHNSPLPIPWACDCVRQAALGLQHAHEQGMVHRDIKPTNLLVTKDDEGRPLTKILDLGLARFVSEMVLPESVQPVPGNGDGSLTQIGEFLGTPDYIAPEQAHDTRAADIRSDIFSLGCTLFRLLTAELPFGGESVLEKLEAREKTAARRVRDLRPDVPAELEVVVARMLARDPRERYQTPREVAQALAPFTGKAVSLPRPALRPAPTVAPTSPGENTLLEQIFRSLATEAADQPMSFATVALRPNRRSPRVAIVIVVLAGLAGFAIWERNSAAILVIDWLLTEREGASLSVAGRVIRLPAEQTFRVSGRAGAWEIHASRDGFEPIDETKMLGRGERGDFSPRWRATPATARRNELSILEARVAEAVGADPLASASAELRGKILAYAHRYPGSREAATAGALLSRLRWPLDLLDGSKVPGDERREFSRFAGDQSGATLAAFFGESRLNFWNGVTAVAASHDGRLLAASSLDGTVQIFDAAEGRRLHVIVSRVAPTELAFSPIGDLLAIAGADGPVTLWHAETGAQASVLVETAAPIAFSRDGKLIAGRAARQEIALWDAQTGELRRTMQGHASGDLRGITFSDDGRMLASFGTDVSVLLWDVASGQERRRFPNAQHPAFSPDGAFLAAGTSAGDLVLWDTRTGETQRTFDEGGYPLAFREQGKSIVSKRLGRAILWSLESGEEIRTLVDVPELAAVSSGGTWLAGCDAAVGELRLWNLEAGTGVRVLNTAGPLAALAFTADGDSLLTGSKTGVVQFWSNEKAAERVASPIRLGPADLSPDGRWLAARSGDRIELVDVSTGNSERTIGSGTSELDSLAFSPDGRLLAGFGGWGFFRTSLRLWDPRASRELTLEDKLAGTVRSIAFSSDSQLLAIAGDSRLVTIWHMVRRKVQYDLDDSTDRVTALAFHPDGRRLAAACIDQSVVLWDLKAEAGKPFAKAGAVCRELVFSPDGEFLAAPAGERVVVWNVDSGKIAAELSTAAGSPSTFAWHPAGTALAAVGNEGCVWLWNEPQSRRFREEPDRVVVLGPPRGIVHRVLWSPDGRHLVTVNGNGTIAVLRLSTEY